MFGTMTDSSVINGFFTVLGMLGVLILGIGSLVAAPPPANTCVEPQKDEQLVRTLMARDLWRR